MNTILDVVREHLGHRSINVPSPRDAWSVRDGRLHVQLDAARLEQNVQTNGPAIPMYALALSYWYERAIGTPLPVVVDIVGQTSDSLHAARGRFMLTELSEAVGDRLTLRNFTPWRLPARPVMNAPQQTRKNSIHRGGKEHQAEVRLTMLETTPMGRLQRQFPLGLFDGKKSHHTRLFPGGGAQADLWSYDEKTRTLHLVELKVGKNAEVGIIPEALTYARLLQRFAAHEEATWSKEWSGSKAARSAERTVVWLLAERFHPLVFRNGDSPLRWVNGGAFAGELAFRVLPFVDGEDVVFGEVWTG